jgi:hypothetical protein
MRYISIRALPEKVDIERDRYEQLCAIAKSQSKERSRDPRRRSRQREKECCGLSEQSETESNLPRAAESEIAPRPRSKNWKQRQQNPPNQ